MLIHMLLMAFLLHNLGGAGFGPSLPGVAFCFSFPLLFLLNSKASLEVGGAKPIHWNSPTRVKLSGLDEAS